MSDELESQYVGDFFDDGDMADAENLPVGPRYIGYVSKVDTSQSVPGSYRKLNKPAKDGRTEVPVISIAITALGRVGEGRFPADVNYYKTSTLDYWIGPEDKGWRAGLRRLIETGLGMAKEDVKAMSMQDGARKLEKVYFTFSVQHRTFPSKNGEGVAQDFKQLKPATIEEIEAVQ